MITEIGIIAGEIWHVLDKRGEITLACLVEDIDKPREMVLMSLGWLAREGHVKVLIEADTYTISLRETIAN
ncbi:MAG: hypothetical protein GY858_07935 [Candidatus Omnitrophica bacterium]|nr:hypothetical protein [Candidatus Omnitrophota bacterium]